MTGHSTHVTLDEQRGWATVAWAGKGKQGPGRARPENVDREQCGGFELWLFLTLASEAELSHGPSESQFLQFKS